VRIVRQRLHIREISMLSTPTPAAVRPRLGLTAGLAALLCIGLAACSGSSTPGAATHPADPAATSAAPAAATSAPATPAGPTGIGTGHPCSLLTQADVAKAIGEAVGTGVGSAHSGTLLCTYSSVSGSIAGGVLVVSSWTKFVKGVRVAKLTQTPVSGIGDEASKLFSQTGQGFPALLVRKGAIGFEVAIHGPSILALPDRGFAKEEALAALILARL
jgi:Protein of unknown function (DUF3558)